MDRSLRKGSIIFFLISLVAYAGNDEELFLRGNKQYESGDYESALASYEQMARKGRAVWYNIGNCLYHKKDYPGALVYWSRAEREATSVEIERIKKNKQHVLQKMGIVKNNSYIDCIDQFIHEITPYFSLLFLQLFFLACWYLLIFAAYKNGRKKRLQLVAMFMCIMCIGFILRACHVKKNMTVGIIVKKQSMLFAGPNKEFHVVAPMLCADCVTVKEKREGWYKVGYSDKIGWVEAEAIQII